ncbi:MAG: hypothetical protein IKO03_05650 [Lachnospiraceae bacterium]|nr:hypothetical protein [Lachnospiraceae bacterium]MBR3508237.1 hypothetical protein [Lachnospiraceae bacterium]MBR6151353.1 hypothetical protein [Lachnospiraceae bacterium]
MTAAGVWFLVIIILNTIVCVLFVIWGYFQQMYSDDSELKRTQMTMPGYYLQAFVMLICPVIGPLFFITAQVIYAYFFRNGADLADVIFGKDKVKAPRKAEEEIERNRVPLEEALAVSDRQSLRGLMLDVVRGDVQKSLASINLALNSEDSETSHYAATVMRDSLNDFRQTSQEKYNAFKEDYAEPEERACDLIEFMNEVLSQEVFPEMEQKGFVEKMDEACTFLYNDEEYRDKLSIQYIEWVGILLLKLRSYDRVQFWCEVAKELFPNELATYTLQLKLYFSMENREKFFNVMEELKKADVVIDRETLELIRIFS